MASPADTQRGNLDTSEDFLVRSMDTVRSICTGDFRVQLTCNSKHLLTGAFESLFISLGNGVRGADRQGTFIDQTSE